MVFGAAILIDRNRLVCFDRKLFQLVIVDFSIKLCEVNILGVLAARIDELINQQRARDNQQPENDLSCSRTQSLRFLRRDDTLIRPFL